jgi:hypothetical protein
MLDAIAYALIATIGIRAAVWMIRRIRGRRLARSLTEP